MLDPAGVVCQTWHVYFMWPKSVTTSELSYSTSEVSEINVSFQFDYAIPGEEIATAANITDGMFPYPASTNF
jgi:hypothetical protein